MARKQRVNFSLAPDVVEKLDEIPDGDRSTFVERAVRQTDLPEEYADE
jgi:metal-responsive CopG/Arc/MetJ family transcriptional regulator